MIDNLDRKILDFLQEQANLSMDKLSELVGLSRNACWTRVKNLESNGIIKGRVALIDAEQIDLGLMLFIQIRTNQHNQDWNKKFSQTVRSIPNVLGVYRMSGDLDYLIRARVADMKGYDALYQRLVRDVPMSDVSASFVMEEIKETTKLPL